MSKEKFMRLPLFTLLAAAGLILVSACAVRVVDPANPAYDRSTFTLADYKTYRQNNPGLPRSFGNDCEAYFPLLIRKGMGKQETESILVKNAGAMTRKMKGNTVRYTFIDDGLWATDYLDIDVTYTKGNKVDMLACNDDTQTPPKEKPRL